MTYLGFSAALYMPLLLFFTQYILRLLDTANMEFVNMFLHLVINCDTCVDRQIHTYLIIACISDISVESDLKFYFMGICKDINSCFYHLCVFQSIQKRNEYSGLTLYYWIWRSTGNIEISMWIWEFRATSYSVKPLYYLYPINKHILKCSDVLD